MTGRSSEEKFLETYDIHEYDIPLVTVDLVIFSIREGHLRVLVVKREAHPEMGKWAVPGGFVDIGRDRDLKAAARRKLEEKTGVRTPYLEQLETLGNGTRDARGWSVTVVYFALIDTSGPSYDPNVPGSRWVAVDDPLLEGLAFDHKKLFQDALRRLRNKVAYTALPVHLLPEEFTLTDLKEVYEIILEREVEKSAFRRRIREANIVEKVPGKKRLGSNRPAQIYRLKPGHATHFFTRNLTGPHTKNGKTKP